MKRILLFIFISIAGLSLQAQTNLDSLYAVWQDKSLPQLSRIKAARTLADSESLLYCHLRVASKRTAY